MEQNLKRVLNLAVKALKMHNSAFEEFASDDRWKARYQIEYQTAIIAITEINKILQKEYCCKDNWQHAKDDLIKQRKSCTCNINEYCEVCWPLDFRPNGKWFAYKE